MPSDKRGKEGTTADGEAQTQVSEGFLDEEGMHGKGNPMESVVNPRVKTLLEHNPIVRLSNPLATARLMGILSGAHLGALMRPKSPRTLVGTTSGTILLGPTNPKILPGATSLRTSAGVTSIKTLLGATSISILLEGVRMGSPALK